MAKGQKQSIEDLLQDIFIAQLAAQGLTQQQIREIVGVDMHRVNRIAKHFRRVAQ